MTAATGASGLIPPPRSPAKSGLSVFSALCASTLCFAVANVSVAAGATVTVATVAWLLSRKRHGLAFLLLISILTFADSRVPALQIGLSLRYPAIVVLGGFALSSALKRGVRPEVMYFLPFVIAAVIGLIVGGGEAGISAGLLKTISYWLLVAVVFQYIAPIVERSPLQYGEAVWRLYAIVIFGGLSLILIAPSIAFFVGGRYRGMMGNPDGMGGLTSLILPFEFAILEATPRRHRRIKWLLIGATILSSLLSGSRGSLIGILIFFLSRAALRLKWRGRLAVAMLAGGLVFGGLRVANDPGVLASPALARFVRPETLETGSGRFFAWAYAIDFIRTAPMFGRGFGFDEYIFDEEHRETVFTDRGGHQGLVHNAYLGIMLDAGIVGLALYIGFLAAVAWRSRAFDALAPMLAVVAWSCIVEGWAVASLNAYTIIFYLGLVFIPRLAAYRQPPYRPLALKPQQS